MNDLPPWPEKPERDASSPMRTALANHQYGIQLTEALRARNALLMESLTHAADDLLQEGWDGLHDQYMRVVEACKAPE